MSHIPVYHVILLINHLICYREINHVCDRKILQLREKHFASFCYFYRIFNDNNLRSQIKKFSQICDSVSVKNTSYRWSMHVTWLSTTSRYQPKSTSILGFQSQIDDPLLSSEHGATRSKCLADRSWWNSLIALWSTRKIYTFDFIFYLLPFTR